MKKIARVHRSGDSHWVGDGFPVRTMFSYNTHGPDVSPFLLLDHAGPADFKPAAAPRGVGQHPHRGFETVTIVYQGEVEHRDSAGNHGRIGPGDVQWMTAARGIIHEEMHGEAFTRTGGTMEMVQLWVNLPAKDKMSKPGYQEIVDAAIPVVNLDDAGSRVRVIAGAYGGAKGPARTFTPVGVWDVRLKRGSTLSAPVPDGHNAIVLNLAGKVAAGHETLARGELAIYERAGEGLALEAGEDSTVLVLSGEPIDEPIFGYGPFVMNTRREIEQAITDFQSGRF